MNNLKTEDRIIGGNMSLSGDIAKHSLERLTLGYVVVVAKQPTALLSSVRKQWLHILHQLENRRAASTDAVKIAEYSTQIARMQQATFSANPLDDTWAHVNFATADQLLLFAPACQTMYVATPTDTETLHKITSFMPEGGEVVIYKTA